MSNKLKLTITGGIEAGRTVSQDFFTSLLVGRSRSSAIHLSEPDVSGKHFEFVRRASDVVVKVLSRNGLVVDGEMYVEGAIAPVKAGSEIKAGSKVVMRIDELPSSSGELAESLITEVPSRGAEEKILAMKAAMGEAAATGGSEASATPLTKTPPPVSADADTGDAKSLPAPVKPHPAPVLPKAMQPKKDSAESTPKNPEPAKKALGKVSSGETKAPAFEESAFNSVATGSSDLKSASRLFVNAPQTKDDSGLTSDAFDDEKTDDGDGETQELKTRVGSMEEMLERKRQLDRASVNRRIRNSVILMVVMVALAIAWWALGSQHHVANADGPFLPNGELDLAEAEIKTPEGQVELAFEFPRDARMVVNVSEDGNTVDVKDTYFGIDRDVPFHLHFTRWRDRLDLQLSLESSFEKWQQAESAAGSVFETRGGKRPEAEFLENLFPGFCEITTQRGVRLMRAEYTRSYNGELWHGQAMYFRKGDMIYLLKTEVPDPYWKRASVRILLEPHVAFCKPFFAGYWDSPGKAAMVEDSVTDDELRARIARELAADRNGSWAATMSYIDTLLIRSWGVKHATQKAALEQYQTLQEKMTRFYNERFLAYETARENGVDKRMKHIFFDCKTMFGAMPRDRRATLVNDPEVWACHRKR